MLALIRARQQNPLKQDLVAEFSWHQSSMDAE
jgi:hypothetical protein